MRPPMPVAATLHDAVVSGSLSLAQKLIAGGAYLNAVNELGNTPLMEAVKNGYVELTYLIVRAEADLSYKNHEGDTVMHLLADQINVVPQAFPDYFFWKLFAIGAIPALDAHRQTPLMRMRITSDNRYARYSVLVCADYEARYFGFDSSPYRNYLKKHGCYMLTHEGGSLSAFLKSTDEAFLQLSGFLSDVAYKSKSRHPFAGLLRVSKYASRILSREEFCEEGKEHLRYLLQAGVRVEASLLRIKDILCGFPEMDLNQPLGVDTKDYVIGTLLRECERLTIETVKKVMVLFLDHGADPNQRCCISYPFDDSRFLYETALDYCFKKYFDGTRFPDLYVGIIQLLLERGANPKASIFNVYIRKTVPLISHLVLVCRSSNLERLTKIAELLLCHGAQLNDEEIKFLEGKVSFSNAQAALFERVQLFLSPDPKNMIDVALNEALLEQNMIVLAKALALNTMLCVNEEEIPLKVLMNRLKSHSLTLFAQNKLAYLQLISKNKQGNLDMLTEQEQEKVAELMGGLYEADLGLDAALAASSGFAEHDLAATKIQKIARGKLVRSLFAKSAGGGSKSDQPEKPSGNGGAKLE